MADSYKLFNQMAGPLFRELSCGVASYAPQGATLVTGHPDTVNFDGRTFNLKIRKAPTYNRKNYVTRTISWILFTLVSIVEVAKMGRFEAALFSSNPPILIFAAIFARLLKKKYGFIVYDIYPDTLVEVGNLGHGNPISIFWSFLNRLAYDGSFKMYTLSDSMAQVIKTNYLSKNNLGIEVVTLPLWVDTVNFNPISKADNKFLNSLGFAEKFIVLYSGNMGLSHDLKGLLMAALLLRAEESIAFVFIGDGARKEEVIDFKNTHNLDNLTILPFQPEKILPMSLGMADLGVVTLSKDVSSAMLPSKAIYYMAVGAALMGVCDEESQLAGVIEKSECGLVINPQRSDQIASEILKLSKDTARLITYKNSARAHCKKFHDKERCLASFIQHLQAK